MSDFDSVEEWREQLLEKCRDLSGEEIVKVISLDTREADYRNIWDTHPSVIESALADDCDQASIIDDVQYLAEDI